MADERRAITDYPDLVTPVAGLGTPTPLLWVPADDQTLTAQCMALAFRPDGALLVLPLTALTETEATDGNAVDCTARLGPNASATIPLMGSRGRAARDKTEVSLVDVTQEFLADVVLQDGPLTDDTICWDTGAGRRSLHTESLMAAVRTWLVEPATGGTRANEWVATVDEYFSTVSASTCGRALGPYLRGEPPTAHRRLPPSVAACQRYLLVGKACDADPFSRRTEQEGADAPSFGMRARAYRSGADSIGRPRRSENSLGGQQGRFHQHHRRRQKKPFLPLSLAALAEREGSAVKAIAVGVLTLASAGSRLRAL